MVVRRHLRHSEDRIGQLKRDGTIVIFQSSGFAPEISLWYQDRTVKNRPVARY
ncbi:hypothetical protein [Desertivirga arenae]|uniref:hypothetical protein n=1 Tax=Desertivirga arenae TaxID=2810309 RepID=UPI001A9676C1|nr:hypothetical protein [Pedobacter sp. SYSU D00823]